MLSLTQLRRKCRFATESRSKMSLHANITVCPFDTLFSSSKSLPFPDLMEYLGHLTKPNHVPVVVPITQECLRVLPIEHWYDLYE